MPKEFRVPVIKSIGEITEDIRKELQSRKAGDSNKHKTGLYTLDNVIRPLRKGRLYIIGGRTGQGKTSLAINFAWNLANRGIKVNYFSLEMTKEELVQRLICSESKVNYEVFELDELSPNVDNVLKGFDAMTKDVKLLFVDSFGHNFEELANTVINLNPKPDVVFVDHIQMVGWQGFKSKYDAVSEYTRKLKELALTQNLIVVALSQINRAGAAGRPSMNNLSSSGVIEEVADVIMLCNNIDPYEIIVGKNRHGKTSEEIILKFEADRYKFRDFTVDEIDEIKSKQEVANYEKNKRTAYK